MLGRMIHQKTHRVSHKTRRRLVTGVEKENAILDQLLLGQPAPIVFPKDRRLKNLALRGPIRMGPAMSIRSFNSAENSRTAWLPASIRSVGNTEACTPKMVI